MTPNTPPQGRDRGCALVITTSPMPTIPARDDPAQVAALLRAVLVLVESGEVEAPPELAAWLAGAVAALEATS